jgi:hypothetical protein
MRLNSMHIARHARRRIAGPAADERGLTIVVVIGILFVVSLMLVAVLTAVNGETALGRNDVDQQKAYAAAQSGIQHYVFHLNSDVNYWTHCNTETNRSLPIASSPDESYTTAPIAATTAPNSPKRCDPQNPVATMIESGLGPAGAGGTFRLKAAGTSRGVSRTFVATFRRKSFLNFMYYTRYETLDPAATSNPAANASCAAPYGTRPNSCTTIDFVSGDNINGPLHSEDWLAVCGSPTFGRTSADSIEAPGHSNEGQRCTDSSNVVGTFNSSAQSLLPPPSNAQLLNIVQPAYHYTGTTYITLQGNSYTVTNNGVTTAGVSYPSNGVIYISTNQATGCPVTYSPFNVDYAAGPGCGNVYVSGNYTSSLTIASDNDIIVNGSITTPTNGSGVPNTNSLLGLIANNFVRVYHPVNNRSGSTPQQCGNNVSNAGGSLSNPSIYAAVLSVNHSFIVDNYDCGTGLGTLKVYGAIAQIFRGPVGTNGGTTGYFKNYTYDDRLASEEPPYFLNPVQAAWSVERMTECTTGGAPC